MDYLKILGVILLAAALGYGAGRYLQPAKVEIKKEEVIKEVEVVRKDVVIVTKETKLPDGTIVKETRTEDRSTETTKTKKEEKESTVVTATKPQWKVQALAGLKIGETGPIYGVGVERRILGPIFVGAYGNTDRQVGVSLSFEF